MGQDNDIVSSASFELIIRPGARCPIDVLDNLGAGLINLMWEVGAARTAPADPNWSTRRR
jgi:hypothetical protein